MAADAPETGFLSERQRRLVAFALGFFALAAIGTMLVLSFVLFSRLVGHFSGVLWPLAVAGITAMILRPVVDRLEATIKGSRLSAVMVLYALFLLVVGTALVLVTPRLVEQVFDFIDFVPEFWQRAIEFVRANYPQWIALAQRQLENETVHKFVESLLAEAQQLTTQALPSIKAAGSGALGVFGFITNLAIVPIYLFFFLLSRSDPTRSLKDQLTFLKEPIRNDVVFLVREFLNIVVSFFRGQMIIGLLMGLLLALGFWIVGLRFAVLIGLCLGILNIVPYLGTIIGLSVALPLAFLQPDGGMFRVGLVLAVFVIVQNIEGWFLTPKIMGDRTGLHPVTIIVAIFFWGAAFNGILGMVLAIPLTAFFVTAWRLAKRKYLTAD